MRRVVQGLEPVVAQEKPQDAPKKARRRKKVTPAAEANAGHDNSKEATVLVQVQREAARLWPR